MTRTVGIILLVAAVGACLIGSVLLGTGLAQGNLEPAGAALGFALLAVLLVGPLAAVGVVILVRVRHEEAEDAEAEEQRKILDMVKTRGEVRISDVIIELHSDLPTVQNMIYDLVGMGVFSGYINWDEGILYSEQASELRDLKQCRNCGGDLSLAGKGVVKCPYCGTEYFLT
jgi:hypothetical protein